MINIVFSEYNSLLKKLQNMQSKIDTLPQGYISKKTINGKEYFYLQNRVNGKVVSKYIKKAEIKNISSKIELSKKYKIEIPQIENRLLELDQAAKLIDKKLCRELMLLKLSFNMDMLTTEQKDKSISFANAMNAIEGVYISDATENKITDWKNGDKSFLSLFNETLAMYGFSTEASNE